MMKIILWLSVGWMPLMMYYMLANETKFKKNIVIGVTLPQEAREDGDVLSKLNGFKTYSAVIASVLIILAVVFYLISGKTNMMIFWTIWLELAIILPYVPYVLTNRGLLEIKREKGWVREKRVAVVDTSALSNEKWMSPWVFAPAVLLSLAAIPMNRDFLLMDIVFIVMGVSFWFAYRYLYRNKAEMVDRNVELTKALSQIRKRNWGKMWVLTAYSMTVFCLAAPLSVKYPAAGLAVIGIVTIALCVAAFSIEMNTRRIQEKLTKDSGGDWYVDDDDKWLGGILYYNPDDSRFVINSRIGVNSSINLATIPGKILTVLLALLLLAMPAFGVFMDSLGTQPIDMAIDGGVLTAKAGMTKYIVDLSEITEVELLETLPKNMSRIYGSAMDTMLKGDFTSSETGKIKVILDPTAGPFLLIRTESGRGYLLGTRDAAATRSLYDTLRAGVN